MKFREQTAALDAIAQDLRQKLERTRAELADTDRRRQELFERIDGILGERNDWQRLYYGQAQAHGVAQEMLLGERNYLLAQLRCLGQKPRTNSQIDAVVAVFEQEHAGPAREALQTQQAEAQVASKSSSGSEVERDD